RLDLKLALIPLLGSRVEIDRLVLVKPDIMLETDAKGSTNWQFTPEPSEVAAQPGSAPREKTQTHIAVADVRIDSGTLTWQDAVAGRRTVIGITDLHATEASPEANLHLDATATYNGTPFTLAGEVGSLARLQGGPQGTTQDTAPWPVKLNLQAAGARLSVDGALTQPLQGRG